jgi:hypothetical protein
MTRTPDTHVVHFDGDYPCRSDGTPITGISHASGDFDLGHGVKARHAFSSKPPSGYSDYYQKMTTYAGIISGPAAVLKHGATARLFSSPEDEDDSVFNYAETASDRAGIGALADRLASERLAIIGVGGTGSYVLDFTAKTPVLEIRLFDDDEFLQHNAFRSPGTPSIEELREAPKKVDYLKRIYSKMHRGIVAHAVSIEPATLHLLDGITFAFICMHGGKAKRLTVEKLEAIGVPFIDVGMGLELVNGSLGGIVRVTTSTPQKREHVHQGRLSFDEGDADDLYPSNIQVGRSQCLERDAGGHKMEKNSWILP